MKKLLGLGLSLVASTGLACLAPSHFQPGIHNLTTRTVYYNTPAHTRPYSTFNAYHPRTTFNAYHSTMDSPPDSYNPFLGAYFVHSFYNVDRYYPNRYNRYYNLSNYPAINYPSYTPYFTGYAA
jgi:hypothetical protein